MLILLNSEGMTAMKLIETTLTARTARLKLASDAEADSPHWIDIQVPISALKFSTDTGEYDLGQPEKRYFGVIQVAALRYARDAISEEIQRLSSLTDR